MIRSFKRLLPILLLCLSVGGTCAAAPAESTSQPAAAEASSSQTASIQIPEPSFNFGETYEGGEVSHDFIVRNTGTSTLQIDQVRPG